MSRLVVATSFPIHPARGGGQERVGGLYGAVAAAGVEVDVVALTARHERPLTHELAPGLREIRVPMSREHHRAENELSVALQAPVTDLALGLHHDLTPAYAEAVRHAARHAAAVVACHPFGLPALRSATDLPLIYESQDVEIDLKTQLLRTADGADATSVERALRAIRDWERDCCRDAALVTTCSAEDGMRLAELFGIPAERWVVVPNGCDCAHVTYAPAQDRVAHRQALAIDGFLALFVGSWHGPNLEAAQLIVQTARARPDLRFLLLGSAGLAIGDDLPANVDAPGPVHERFLDAALRLADVAVNPMRSGSGTNLKMLRYAAAGVPMVSSAFGARGLGLRAGEHYVSCDPDELEGALDSVRDEDAELTAARSQRARDHVVGSFDWPAIAAAWLRHPTMRTILER